MLCEKRSGGNIQYFYGIDGILGFTYQGEKYYYVKDVQGSVVNIMRVRNEGKALFAHYEYDVWGNCTVYDKNGNVDMNFSSIGNINPFRWKGFYYDMETELYYANGSYYDPQTGKYLDASHIDSVFENAYSTRSLDRNGLMCNNVLELEDSPYTVETTVELSADLSYDRESELSWIAKAELWVRKAVVFISKQFEQLPWYAKLVVGIVLTALAILITVATKGSALGIVAELALGIGFGVVGYAVGTSALSETFTLEGLGNAILDAFFVTSIFVFVAAGINYLKSYYRGNIKYQLKRRAKEYRRKLKRTMSKDKLGNIDFVSAVYDSEHNIFYVAYNSETILMDSELNSALQGLGLRTSCSEVLSINKALNAGSQISNIYMYTIKMQNGSMAYACKVCERVFKPRIAKSFTPWHK